MNIYEALEDFDYSVEKALASYAKIDLENAKDLVKQMALSDYMALVSAFDNNDEQEITNIINKYISNENSIEKVGIDFFESKYSSKIDKLEERFIDFIKSANLYQISESSIFSKFDIFQENFYRAFSPKIIKEALDISNQMSYTDLYKSLGRWYIKENLTERQAKDIFIMKHIFENSIPMQLKNDIAKLTNKPVSAVINPQMTDPKTNKSVSIVSADPRSKTVAVQDDKGNIDIETMNNPKDQEKISLGEEISVLKKLAGIK